MKLAKKLLEWAREYEQAAEAIKQRSVAAREAGALLRLVAAEELTSAGSGAIPHSASQVGLLPALPDPTTAAGRTTAAAVSYNALESSPPWASSIPGSPVVAATSTAISAISAIAGTNTTAAYVASADEDVHQAHSSTASSSHRPYSAAAALSAAAATVAAPDAPIAAATGVRKRKS